MAGPRPSDGDRTRNLVRLLSEVSLETDDPTALINGTHKVAGRAQTGSSTRRPDGPQAGPARSDRAKPSKPPEQEYHSFLCIDFESTCVDADHPRYGHLSRMQASELLKWGYPNEIIEWPVVLLQWRAVHEGDAVEDKWVLRAVDRYRSFVKPAWNSQLDPFCTVLTGITQSDVDPSPSLPEVLTDFDKTFVRRHGLFAKDNKTVWVTDGPWDFQDHFLKSIFLSPATSAHPLPAYLQYPLQILDLRRVLPLFVAKFALPRAPSLSLRSSLACLGLSFEGREHTGIDDAINVGRCLSRMVELSDEKTDSKGRWVLKPGRTVMDKRWDWMGKKGKCTFVDPAKPAGVTSQETH